MAYGHNELLTKNFFLTWLESKIRVNPSQNDPFFDSSKKIEAISLDFIYSSQKLESIWLDFDSKCVESIES